MIDTSTRQIEKALLISVYTGDTPKETAQEHLEELELLTKTYGAEVAGKELCFIRYYESSTFVTKGKLEELIKLAGTLQANTIIFDDEMSPSQQKNLEAAFKMPVLDRTYIILEVFAKRAQTKEARLQIELAKVRYEAPRLKRLWSHLSRQAGTAGGGGAYLKGEGEKQIEIDRRILKSKIDDLQKEIKAVRQNRQTLRTQRVKAEIPVFAIIGYTNAGKSTLLNALTEADVLVEDKLFATLDTTTRRFTLPNNQDILLVDTVGFIRKLPHLLVAAFKSTLEEAVQADILLHLVDASHPMAEEQAATTYEVLKELNTEKKPVITVLNKSDRAENKAVFEKLRLKYPFTVSISALEKTGLEDLQEIMIQELSKLRKTVELKIPQSEYGKIAYMQEHGKVLNIDYDENDILIKAELPLWLANKLTKS